jgi:hypothetical protein
MCEQGGHSTLNPEMLRTASAARGVKQPRIDADNADQNRNQGASATSTSAWNCASWRMKQPQINPDETDQKR